jgi:hypothetical protein
MEPAGQWPPQWQNDLAAAYDNRGVARRAQGQSAEAVADYARCIELMERSLFAHGYAPTLPWLVVAHANLARLDTPERARLFVTRLERAIDPAALPPAWRAQVDALRRLVR